VIKVLLATVLACTAAAAAMAVELPAEIAKQGNIKVAIVPNYPPMEFRDPATNTLTGFDVELGEALGRKLGLKIVWEETSFDQMMPGIATGRVDAILSGMTDFASRHDAATFVDYLRNGPRFFTLTSRAAEFKDPMALCGKTVGASRRSSAPKDRPMQGHSSSRAGSMPPFRAARRCPTSWTSNPALIIRLATSSPCSSPALP
jgi:polar amino acid transport system substrate-binding protein